MRVNEKEKKEKKGKSFTIGEIINSDLIEKFSKELNQYFKTNWDTEEIIGFSIKSHSGISVKFQNIEGTIKDMYCSTKRHDDIKFKLNNNEEKFGKLLEIFDIQTNNVQNNLKLAFVQIWKKGNNI